MTKAERELAELEALVAERDERTLYNRLKYTTGYYPFQKSLMASGKENAQTLLMAANRVGKTWIGGTNMAYHLTGLYPDWWEGHKWEHPIHGWAAGVSSESTRDILQEELLGPAEDSTQEGTGTIPRHCIGIKTRKHQVPNAFQTVLVKHYTNGEFDGWSRLTFKAFEQGDKKFMGKSIHEIWLDEQPPDSLFGQCVTRTADTGGRVTMTFTPEDGMTKVVWQFLRDIQPGQNLISATWEDAPHLTPEVQKQLLNVYDEAEREMRSKGIPLFGSGPVFLVDEGDLRVDPFEIPAHWPQIVGIDFGWEHPTAVVWFRIDPESGRVYVVDCYRKNKTVALVHAAAINERPAGPVAWPHDGYQHEKGSGVTLADSYRNHGVQMLPTNFTNPLALGESGKGNYKVEPGINAMHEAMQTGQFKVFSTCFEWFEEYRFYHREDGKIIKIKDDLMSATRYGYQSRRFADVPSKSSGFWSKEMPELPQDMFLV